MSRWILVPIFALLAGVLTISPDSRGVQIKNGGTKSLWLMMTGEESFIIPPGQMGSILLEPGWTGEIYAQNPECEFEACNNPHTTAWIGIGQEGGGDHYKVSVKDGYNRPITIRSMDPYEYCNSTSCNINLSEKCPETHKVNNTKGELIACRPNPTVFKKLCPQAVTSDDDNTKNTLICKKSDSYQVLFG